MENLKKKIRDIIDFPKPGIVFKDITTLLNDAAGFQKAVDLFGNRYINTDFKYIVGIEARGFLIGAALAYKLCKGIVLIRKKGKLPGEKITAEYELEYGKDILEIHKDAIKKGDKVIIVDDLLATGGTVRATIELVERLGGVVVECGFLCELEFLKGREKLKDYNVYSLLKF